MEIGHISYTATSFAAQRWQEGSRPSQVTRSVQKPPIEPPPSVGVLGHMLARMPKISVSAKAVPRGSHTWSSRASWTGPKQRPDSSQLAINTQFADGRRSYATPGAANAPAR